MEKKVETALEPNVADGLRRCGLFLSVIFALAAWSFLWKEQAGGLFFTLAAFFLLILTLFKPSLFKRPCRLLSGKTGVRSHIMIQLVLPLVFFLIFVPVGLCFRILKRDPLALKMPKDGWSYWDRGPDSYWIPRKKHRICKERYERQY